MSLVQNEQTKLTATAVSNLGLALVVAGFAAPLVAVSFNLSTAPTANRLTIAVSLAWLALGFVLHVAGRRFLLRLRP